MVDRGPPAGAAGVAVRVEVHHPDRTVRGDGPEDGQGQGMVAAGRDRHRPRRVHLAKERLDVVQAVLETKGTADEGVADVAHPAELIRVDAVRGVERPHESGLVPDLARAVAGAGSVRHPAVERHADERDVRLVEVLGVRRPHEGGNAGVAGPLHRIGERVVGHRGLLRSSSRAGRLCAWPGRIARAERRGGAGGRGTGAVPAWPVEREAIAHLRARESGRPLATCYASVRSPGRLAVAAGDPESTREGLFADGNAGFPVLEPPPRPHGPR